jgi:DNA-binding MarR family transcriptional regulator
MVSMVGCYVWGRYFAKSEILESIVGTMLDRLEKDGFVRTITDKDGEKELVPISEIIKKSA